MSPELLTKDVQLIAPLDQYKIPNNRLDGLRKLLSVGAPIPSPLYVVTDQAFLLFKEDYEKFIQRIAEETEVIAEETAAQSNKKSITLRRAFMVPDPSKPGKFLSNPEGQRYLGVAPKELPERIRDLFIDAQRRGYDVPKSRIAGFFYPFIDPQNKPLAEIAAGDKLPFGGHITPEDSSFIIWVGWGNNETIMYQEKYGKPIEMYEFAEALENAQRISILKKHVVPKDIMHYTDWDGTSGIVPVPLTHQLEPILHDSDIVDIARDAHAGQFYRLYGPHRIEFTSDGEKIIFNEAIDRGNPKENVKPEIIVAQGRVFALSSASDIERLAKLSNEELTSTLVYYTDRERESITGSLLAQRFSGIPLTVLIDGRSNISHDSKVFTDVGFRPVAIGKQFLQEGDEVNIQLSEPPVIENKTISSITEVVPLSLAHIRGIQKVGGKAERLAVLEQHGLLVPRGAVLTTDFFDAVVSRELVDLALQTYKNNPTRNILSELIEDLPDKAWNTVLPLLERFGLLGQGKKIIARSSANVEDARNKSFAGRFESVPYAQGEIAIRRAVLECLHSAYSPRVLAYLGEEGARDLVKIKLAIIVQEMVDAEVSGVIFGGNPATQDRSKIVVEAKIGLAEGIVNGEGFDQKLIINKAGHRIEIKRGLELLSQGQVKYLTTLSDTLENIFHYPQDVEWSIDQSGKLWIIQSRDL